jgi:hypothetical protein
LGVLKVISELEIYCGLKLVFSPHSFGDRSRRQTAEGRKDGHGEGEKR